MGSAPSSGPSSSISGTSLGGALGFGGGGRGTSSSTTSSDSGSDNESGDRGLGSSAITGSGQVGTVDSQGNLSSIDGKSTGLSTIGGYNLSNVSSAFANMLTNTASYVNNFVSSLPSTIEGHINSFSAALAGDGSFGNAGFNVTNALKAMDFLSFTANPVGFVTDAAVNSLISAQFDGQDMGFLNALKFATPNPEINAKILALSKDMISKETFVSDMKGLLNANPDIAKQFLTTYQSLTSNLLGMVFGKAESFALNALNPVVGVVGGMLSTMTGYSAASMIETQYNTYAAITNIAKAFGMTESEVSKAMGFSGTSVGVKSSSSQSDLGGPSGVSGERDTKRSGSSNIPDAVQDYGEQSQRLYAGKKGEIDRMKWPGKNKTTVEFEEEYANIYEIGELDTSIYMLEEETETENEVLF